MVASKGHGTTNNSTAQQQNIRHNHQYYGITAKATAQLSLSLHLDLNRTFPWVYLGCIFPWGYTKPLNK